jgi:hypothetical protein
MECTTAGTLVIVGSNPEQSRKWRRLFINHNGLRGPFKPSFPSFGLSGVVVVIPPSQPGRPGESIPSRAALNLYPSRAALRAESFKPPEHSNHDGRYRPCKPMF